MQYWHNCISYFTLTDLKPNLKALFSITQNIKKKKHWLFGGILLAALKPVGIIEVQKWRLTMPVAWIHLHTITHGGLWEGRWRTSPVFSPENGLRSSSSSMSSGPEKAVVHLDLFPLLAEVHLLHVDAVLSCVHRQWLLEVFSSPCSDVTTQSRLVPMLRCQKVVRDFYRFWLFSWQCFLYQSWKLQILWFYVHKHYCYAVYHPLHFLYFRNTLASNTQTGCQLMSLIVRCFTYIYTI